MKTLHFEAAGMSGTQRNDVSNCRLRTRIKNKKGRLIYLEIGGHEVSNRAPSPMQKYNILGRVDHCFYDDIEEDAKRNYSKNLVHIEHFNFEYTLSNILKLVNDNLECDFDNLLIDESLRVHDTDEALTSCNG